MIPELKPYPKMKHSGVEWLGEVPGHWDVLPGLAAYQPRDVRNTGMLETTVLSLSYGRIVVKSPHELRGLLPESYETYQIVDPGNIIVRPTDLQNDRTSLRVGQVRDRGIITSAYLCLETTLRMSNGFGYQYLNALDLLKVIYGFGSGLRQNLSFADIKRMPVVVPPLPEQAAIVQFLDYAHRRIHRYIRAKRKLIKLLEEQKQAIIHRAVTRGLDPDVPLKDSGVEWLGKVPEHWKVCAFSRLAVERADYRGATPRKTDRGVFLVTARNVRKGWIDYETSKEYVAEEEYSTIMRRGLPRVGDLLLTTEAPLGHAALVDREDIALAQRIIRFRFDRKRLRSEFALHSVRSPYFQHQLNRRATGSTALGIKASKLPELRILCPPPDEQRRILEHIEMHCRPLEVSLERSTQEIALLRELRTRIIADVVTGKLDVRDVADRLPDDENFVEEDDDLDEDEATLEDSDLDAELEEIEA